MGEKQLSRAEVPVEFTWDLSPLYKSEEDWEKDFSSIEEMSVKLIRLQGKLAESSSNLKLCLELEDELSRKLEKLYTYAHLKSDEDKTNAKNQGIENRITQLYHNCSAQLAWIQPELMQIDDPVMKQYLESPELTFYRFALEQKLRYKPHTLSDKEEQILAMSREIAGVPTKAFSMLNNADIKFPAVTDETGNQIKMTHALYNKFLQSYDRRLRQDAFDAMYSTFKGMVNTMATLLDGAVKGNSFYAKAKKYSSAIEASLFKDNVDVEVYTNLVKMIDENLSIFHKYVALRKKVLNIEQLDMYDMYVPLVKDFDMEIPWEEACQWVLESLKPLGPEYLAIAEKAFKNRWIDVLENKGKRSGAYSSGCYDSYPYMLLNYNKTLNSVFTLAHELGHSMHSYLSRQAREYRYSSYPIILAEVASTTNELLLLDYLLKKTDNEEMKKYLLNHYCDSFKGTIYRQVQFAEFEMDIHEKSEKGIPLTVDELNNSYYELNKRYYGADVKADQQIQYEWARIPHFYYNFYVYKYATGFSAACQFTENILSGDQEKIDAYLTFLESGSIDEPLNILKKAGVDLTQPETITSGLKKFDSAISELLELL